MKRHRAEGLDLRGKPLVHAVVKIPVEGLKIVKPEKHQIPLAGLKAVRAEKHVVALKRKNAKRTRKKKRGKKR